MRRRTRARSPTALRDSAPPTHFSGEQIQQLTGARLVHVPYKGGVGSMQAAMTGEVQVAIGFAATALPVIRSGKVRVLALVEGKGFGALAGFPAAADVIPGFQAPPSWGGVFGPAALPQPLLARLNGDIVKAIQSPELRARGAEEGLEIVGSSPKEFAANLRKQTELIRRIAKAADIRPAALTRLEHFPERSWRNDLQPPHLSERKDLQVSGDKYVGASLQRGSQNDGVIGIHGC